MRAQTNFRIFWKYIFDISMCFQKMFRHPRSSISHGSKLQQSTGSAKWIWCLANWLLQSFWLSSAWPYICETLRIWFFSRDFGINSNSYLIDHKLKGRDKWSIQLLDDFCIWCTARVYSEADSVQFIFVWYSFFSNDIDLASYADDSTPYRIGETAEQVITKFEKCSKSIFE